MRVECKQPGGDLVNQAVCLLCQAHPDSLSCLGRPRVMRRLTQALVHGHAGAEGLRAICAVTLLKALFAMRDCDAGEQEIIKASQAAIQALICQQCSCIGKTSLRQRQGMS